MSIIDKLKDLKEQLPKTTLGEKVQMEDNNPMKHIKTEVRPEIEEEEGDENEGTHPYIGPAKENYILLSTFKARFKAPDCFIRPDQIFLITKPSYDVINSKLENKFKISFTMVDAKHYFGKPSEYTNFKLDYDLADLVKNFNQNPPEWFEISEYDDDAEIPRIFTRYWGLKIIKLEFSECNTMSSGMMKYYTITLSFEKEKTSHEKLKD